MKDVENLQNPNSEFLETDQNQCVQSEKALGIAELIYGTIFSPSKSFQRLSDSNALFNAFLIYIVIVVLKALVNFFLPPSLVGVPPQYAEIISKVGPFLAILGAITSIAFWLGKAGIIQVFSELYGGGGHATGVLTVLALAALPTVLIIPFQVLSYFLGDSAIGQIMGSAPAVLAYLWSFVLLIMGLKATQKFSTGRAIAVIFTPLMLAAFVMIVFIIGTIVMVAPLITDM